MPILTPNWLRQLPAYASGAHQTENHENPIVLSANENNDEASPQVIHAIARAATKTHQYPETGAAQKLVASLRATHNLPQAHDGILIGNGSDELIELLCRVALTDRTQCPNPQAVMHDLGFVMYAISTTACAAEIVRIPAIAQPASQTPHLAIHTNVDGIIAAGCHNDAKIVFIANPNNPTGELLPYATLKHIVTSIPADRLIVIDVAYAEYAEEAARAHKLVYDHDNVLVLRTFSKAYALAGLRIGWAHAHHTLIEMMGRLRLPFSVNRLALEAGIAACQNPPLAHVRITQQLRDEWAHILRGWGAAVPDSHGNFLMVAMASAGQAQAVITLLNEAGVIVRPLAPYNLPYAFRMTIGTPDQMATVKPLIKHAVTEAQRLHPSH
ncbi:MAG: aminotransferase class I/II-fold pyridoxal phosphate-dependent enzyme [Alphaproteobacteria bacterium]|nr:aminotransferase class I/II-fold pyridoxal phosphate-dependent enzyme [Alphaproteobacteria bacterium]